MADVLATAAQLRTYLELEEPELTVERAELFVGKASGLVCGYVGHTFTETTTTRVYDGSGSNILLLDVAPLLDVVSVEAGPRSGRTALVEDVDYEWSEDGMLRRLGGYVWPRRFGWVEAEVRHGYAEVPDDVVGIVLRVAARGIVNPEGLAQETAGGYQAGYGQGDERLVTLARADRRDLDPYRLAP